jgi:hypothetical protein
MATKLAPLFSVILAASLAACGGPVLLWPGGHLEGQTVDIPGDWSFTDDVNTVQLETRAADPYSVNLWLIALDQSLYVHAGTSRSEWVENMEADPNVRLRVGESIYELAAVRVEDQATFDRFSDAYEKKYGNRPRNESVVEAYLFRLGAR